MFHVRADNKSHDFSIRLQAWKWIADQLDHSPEVEFKANDGVSVIVTAENFYEMFRRHG